VDAVERGERKAEGGTTAGSSEPEVQAREVTVDRPASGRVVSLDVFRGITIAAMILVNDPGGPSYEPLDHAEWNGWTHTDLIFPFFMFIAGASMALSFARRKEQSGAERKKLALHTLRRGSLIFLIGLLLNLFPWFFDWQHYANLRIPGVLQRIGFCYVFAGLIYLYMSKRTRIAIIATALLGYWAAMKLIPVPGIGAGDLTPNNNLAAYIDNAIFGVRHMWQHRPWDPEGLLSSVPALCTMLLGTLVGEMFVSRQLSVGSSQGEQNQNQTPKQVPLSASGSVRNDNSIDGFVRNDNSISAGKAGFSDLQSTWQYKVKQLVLWGVTAVVVGEVWGVWFPINKNLWTSSYVVFTAGYATLALAVIYWIVDVRGWRKWSTPFLVFGSNAILVFTLSNWLTKMLLILKVPAQLPNGQQGSMSVWSWLIVNGWRPHFADIRNSSLAFALSYVLFWLAIMWWFYKKRIFVKI
jgi:predicted acyltransferase